MGGLEERKYSVLIVSEGLKFNAALFSLMPESRFSPVKYVSCVNAAKREWIERSYDFVVINSPLRDDPGLEFAIDISSSRGVVVLLLVAADLFGPMMERVRPHGVYTLAKPLSRASLETAFDWMASTRERLRSLERKTLSIEERMNEIRVVNRAKWLLISELGMDEPHAHRDIEKQAMDSCISRREVADQIIKTYSSH